MLKAEGLTLEVTRPILTPRGSKSERRVCSCWWARICVGAMSTLWYPLRKARYMATAATTVFPDPTSPIIKRLAGVDWPKSLMMSLIARVWAGVRSNGRLAVKVTISFLLISNW